MHLIQYEVVLGQWDQYEVQYSGLNEGLMSGRSVTGQNEKGRE